MAEERFALRFGNIALETTRVLPVVLSIVVIALSTFGFLAMRSMQSATERLQLSTTEIATVQTKELIARVKSLETKISNISKSLDAASAEQLSQVAANNLENELKQVSQGLSSLKDIIVESPEKALAIPLLRKEMDELQEKHTALVASMNTQIDRIYDFSKWFLGLMITLAVGLVTMGFVRRPKSND